MDLSGGQTYEIPWMEDPLGWDTTEQSLVVEMAASEGSMGTGLMAAVIVGVLATIVLLFSFALLLDCRNKKREREKQQRPGRRKPPAKRGTFPQFISNSSSNRDNISFVNQMCEDSDTTPASMLAGSSGGPCPGATTSTTLHFPSKTSTLFPQIHQTA